MRSYTARFHVDAPPRKVWRVLHPPAPPNSPRPRVLTWPTGRMEILNEGDGSSSNARCMQRSPATTSRRTSTRSVTRAECDGWSRDASRLGTFQRNMN